MTKFNFNMTSENINEEEIDKSNNLFNDDDLPNIIKEELQISLLDSMNNIIGKNAIDYLKQLKKL